MLVRFLKQQTEDVLSHLHVLTDRSGITLLGFSMGTFLRYRQHTTATVLKRFNFRWPYCSGLCYPAPLTGCARLACIYGGILSSPTASHCSAVKTASKLRYSILVEMCMCVLLPTTTVYPGTASISPTFPSRFARWPHLHTLVMWLQQFSKGDIETGIADALWQRLIWQLFVKKGVVEAFLGCVAEVPLWSGESLFKKVFFVERKTLKS